MVGEGDDLRERENDARGETKADNATRRAIDSVTEDNNTERG